ncbi:membrane protein [Helicobacter pylori PZ5026]|nr:membrane protein [Helicobacter pylori PZ5026]
MGFGSKALSLSHDCNSCLFCFLFLISCVLSFIFCEMHIRE